MAWTGQDSVMVPQALARRATAPALGAEDRFFLIATWGLLGVIAVGFARTFFLKPLFDAPTVPLYVYVHGTVMTAWFVLLPVQATLIARGRRDLHRTLGIIGVVVAGAVVAFGAALSYLAFPRHAGLVPASAVPHLLDQEGPLIMSNFTTLALFAICVAAAVGFRRQPAVHKRLMLVGSVAVAGPAIDRVWRAAGVTSVGPVALTILALVITLVALDWRARRRAPWLLIAGFALMFAAALIGSAWGASDSAHSLLLSWAGLPALG